ncbi:MAG: translation initiation factor IF-3 [Myxococcales bacterium FL481]|nr:MAG: translation initiation factor IF-3 [Myxococcales bacterium FL481]
MGRRKRSRPAPRPETHRVGRRIRVREVRVIDHEGQQRGIMDTNDALDLAEEVGLQLVEVNPKTSPPVCKILDYGKFKYENSKRESETKRNRKTQEVKEVKFRPKTHHHDFDFKVKHVRRFLEEGDKVKLLVQFRGREITHPETGRAVLERVCKETADLATVIQLAQMEGNRMNMVLAPKANRPPPKARPPASADVGAKRTGPAPSATSDSSDKADNPSPAAARSSAARTDGPSEPARPAPAPEAS